MKKFLILLLVLSAVTAASAQTKAVADGYYRIQNKNTTRYITVIDDKGGKDVATTDIDLGALVTLKSFERVVSNPGSIIYIEKLSDGGYKLKSQGTDTKTITGYSLKLYSNSDGTYRAYGEQSGMVKYLCDQKDDLDTGMLRTEGSCRDWYLKPVTQEDGNYFGFTPEFTVGSDYYASIYASFPFSLNSAGMKAYYITKVGKGMAAFKEVTGGNVPASTPVIVKLASAKYVDNKVTLLASSPAAVSGSMLRGVYFRNPNKVHYNQKANDPATMRVLGVTSDGSIGFVTSTEAFLPANKAYLVVPTGTPAELKLVSEEGYATGITDIHTDDDTSKSSSAYTLTGVKVGSLDNVPAGIYIVNGKKIIVR